MSNTNSLADNLDSVLRKYGKIWIWSILSAAVAALSLRYFAVGNILQLPALSGFATSPRATHWSIFWGLLAFVPSLGTLASVYYLFQFLRYHILPILFPERRASLGAPTPESAPVSQGFTLTGAPIVEYAARRRRRLQPLHPMTRPMARSYCIEPSPRW